MKVKELIQLLEKLDGEKEIAYDDSYTGTTGGYYDIRKIEEVESKYIIN